MDRAACRVRIVDVAWRDEEAEGGCCGLGGGFKDRGGADAGVVEGLVDID